jgi:hypothetical protein
VRLESRHPALELLGLVGVARADAPLELVDAVELALYDPRPVLLRALAQRAQEGGVCVVGAPQSQRAGDSRERLALIAQRQSLLVDVAARPSRSR